MAALFTPCISPVILAVVIILKVQANQSMDSNPVRSETTMNPLSLYIHLPWCVRKCPYCDFNSHAVKGILPYAKYVDALLKDLSLSAPNNRTIHSIYLGGGTPSLFPSDEIARLLTSARAVIPFEPGAEITLEANPGTVEHDHFTGYAQAGVNRISLGAQTFNDAHLKTLGRIHGGDDIARAVAEIKAAGIQDFNVDIMHGLPGQTVEEGVDDLRQAIALNPTHLSWYQLTIEPNTLFAAKPPTLPDERVLGGLETQGKSLLAAEGFDQYEVSAYAKAGKASQHNMNYWRFGDYLGIGAGAHGKITDEDGQVFRTAKYKHPQKYLECVECEIHDPIHVQDLPFEFMMNALRLNEGFTVAQFESATGLPFSSTDTHIKKAVAQGLLTQKASHIAPSPKGRLFLNELLQLWL
jgi:oxygen-independent coproporphyrinogen-3 oxidase